MSREVDIEECLVEAIIQSGIMKSEAMTLITAFYDKAYPDLTRHYQDGHTETKKNGFRTACMNQIINRLTDKGYIK